MALGLRVHEWRDWRHRQWVASPWCPKTVISPGHPASWTPPPNGNQGG